MAAMAAVMKTGDVMVKVAVEVAVGFCSNIIFT